MKKYLLFFYPKHFNSIVRMINNKDLPHNCCDAVKIIFKVILPAHLHFTLFCCYCFCEISKFYICIAIPGKISRPIWKDLD